MAADSTEELSAQDHSALIAAWSQIATSIRDQKRELWTVTYYTLLLLAATLTVSIAPESLKALRPDLIHLAVAFSTVLSGWAMLYIWNGFVVIGNYRRSMRKIEEAVDGRFEKIIKPVSRAPLEGWHVPLMQSLSVAVAWSYLLYEVGSVP